MQEIIQLFKDIACCLLWISGIIAMFYIDYVIIKEWKKVKKEK